MDYHIHPPCTGFEVSVKYIFHFPFWIADTIVVSQYAAKYLIPATPYGAVFPMNPK